MGKLVTILHGGAYDDLGVIDTLESPIDEFDLKTIQDEWFVQIPLPFDLDGSEWEIHQSFINYLIEVHGWKKASNHELYNMGYEGIEQIKQVKDTFINYEQIHDIEYEAAMRYRDGDNVNCFHLFHAIIKADGSKVWRCAHCEEIEVSAE